MTQLMSRPAKSPARGGLDIVPAVLAFVLSAAHVLIPLQLGLGVDVYGAIGLPGAFLEFLGFYVVAVWALGRIFFRGSAIRRFGPAAATSLAVLLVWPFGLEMRVTEWNFRSRLAARTEVVELIRTGKVERIEDGPCACYYGRLSPEHAYLSASGIVLIAPRGNELSVTFFVRRELMFPEDDYTAFVYRSDPGVPTDGVEGAHAFFEVVSLAPNWFFVLHS